MGARGANSTPTLGNRPLTIRELSPVHALHPNTNRPKPVSPGQRTMPIAGAPLLPPNPFLNIMRLMLAYRK
ncbi:MAG: hypothetical protein WCB11_01450 [Terriglobales bacterium]|jgi:hypothetical protein